MISKEDFDSVIERIEQMEKAMGAGDGAYWLRRAADSIGVAKEASFEPGIEHKEEFVDFWKKNGAIHCELDDNPRIEAFFVPRTACLVRILSEGGGRFQYQIVTLDPYKQHDPLGEDVVSPDTGVIFEDSNPHEVLFRLLDRECLVNPNKPLPQI